MSYQDIMEQYLLMDKVVHKTFTMYGEDIYDDNTKGIIPRLINDIFNHVENEDENITFQFK